MSLFSNITDDNTLDYIKTRIKDLQEQMWAETDEIERAVIQGKITELENVKKWINLHY
jgi:hypothetical protein